MPTPSASTPPVQAPCLFTPPAREQPLEALTLPLCGSVLIEASAGTGKTFTIASLYLRFILGLGPGLVAPEGGTRALQPREILVMTFTKAATQELVERIRSRLSEAADAFEGRPGASAPSGFLKELLEALPSPGQRQQAHARLRLAAQSMDEAAIFTIDAWCQRMLREHAFDSGAALDDPALPHEAKLLRQACEDHFRSHYYPLDAESVAQALSVWPQPEALFAEVNPLMNVPLPSHWRPEGLADRLKDRADRLAQLKAGWETRAKGLKAWAEGLMQAEEPPLHKNTLSSCATDWCQALIDWARNPRMEAFPKKLTAAAQTTLTPTGIRAKLRKGHTLPPLPDSFTHFEALLDGLKSLGDVRQLLLEDALPSVRERVAQLKQASRQLGFSDRLRRLDAALDPVQSGERAERLRQRILAQYPAALIDEFQDTSPTQLRVFDRLYRIADNEPSRALLLIGDPKQAIYAFRGADIHCYLRAKRDTHGRHQALGTNYRSTKEVVEGVNAWFEQAETDPNRQGEGAFLFGRGEGAGGQGGALPFNCVKAQGRSERLMQGGQGLPALTLAFEPQALSKSALKPRMAERCAERIVGLLNDASVGFERPGAQGTVRLQPSDIAVLVRGFDEAAEVRAALQRRGLGSVYLSERESVLQSPEAQDLLRVLQALCGGLRAGDIRAAMATRLMARSLQEMQALADDERLASVEHARWLALWQGWQQRGLLALVRKLMLDFGLAERWLPQPQGERCLSNLQHLAELLMAEAGPGASPLAQMQSLHHMVVAADEASRTRPAEEQLLRLESDAALVRVVTVHKSKGLEYPLVFVPFGGLDAREEKKGQAQPYAALNAQGERELRLQPSPEELQARHDEELQEGLRLLYVALTRAQHHLWVGASIAGQEDKNSWHRSALGCLFTGRQPQKAVQIAQAVQARAQQAKAQLSLWADEAPMGRLPVSTWAGRQHTPQWVQASELSPPIERHWGLSSYSALVKASGDRAPERPQMSRALREDEPVLGLPAVPDTPSSAGPPNPSDAPWHRFPKGAYPGNFLHEQLEWLAGEGFKLDGPRPDTLRRRCTHQGWAHRAEEVLAWMQALCSTPLPPLGACLQALPAMRPEMEFWLPLDNFPIERLDRLCRQHLFPGQARPALSPRTLSGLMMGFADLVYERPPPSQPVVGQTIHQTMDQPLERQPAAPRGAAPSQAPCGPWGVLDYKSNALGESDAAYTPAAMAQAMLEHRYDVQAAIYLLALHRLLALRLGPHYRLEEHLHGALFVFLRGVGAPGAGCLHLPAPPVLIEALDALLPAGLMSSGDG